MNKLKLIFIDDNKPILKEQGTFNDLEKAWKNLKIKYKGKR